MLVYSGQESLFVVFFFDYILGSVLGMETTSTDDFLCIVVFVLERGICLFDLRTAKHVHTNTK